MALTTSGANLIAAAIVGGTYTAFTNANSYVGVGDSTAAVVNTQTALQAGSNFLLKQCDTSFPTQSGTTLTFQATFANTDAVFSWQEIGIFNGSTQGGSTVMLDRFLSAFGSKPNNQSWVLTVTLTVVAS